MVVANPPYMGGRGLNDDLKDFAKDQYPDSKSDLFAMFIERNLELTLPKGLVGMITMQSWMFLSSFESLRTQLLEQKSLVSMAHLGPRAFDTISGEVVSTTAFVARNHPNPDFAGTFLRLIDGDNEAQKAEMLHQNIPNGYQLPANCYRATSADFKQIPGSPIAYWVSDRVREIFKKALLLKDLAEVKHGLSTGKNDLLVRFWAEVSRDDFGPHFDSIESAHNSRLKWFPYNKGGQFRKWYGNNEYVLRYDEYGVELMATLPGHRHDGKSHYFKEGGSFGFQGVDSQ
jgi:hypothetical protein